MAVPFKTTREVSPCKDCTERFTACTDHCPKDKRGEDGYDAYRERLKREKDARKEYYFRYGKYYHYYGEVSEDG